VTDLVTETDLFKDGEGLKEGKESQIIDYFNQSIKVLLEVTVDGLFYPHFVYLNFSDSFKCRYGVK